MKQIHQIKLFISCPGDVIEELSSIKLIIEEINKTSGKKNGYSIENLSWKLDTYTQIAEDPQEVINNQLDSQYDILVALLWQKVGTPTKRYKSGTIEEINRAILNHSKEFLIYFNIKPPDNLNLINIEKLLEINAFKEDLSKRGVLYKEYDSINLFESLFRINIINLIDDKILPKEDTSNKSGIEVSNAKYGSIIKLIDEVERKSDVFIDLDIFELIEKLKSSISIVTSSTNSMTFTINNLAEKLTTKTRELTAFLSIKDDKLRINKTKIVVDLLSIELDEFNNRMSQELSSFSENYISIGPTYAKIISYASNYNITEVDVLKQSFEIYRNTIEKSTETGASLLSAIVEWQPVNAKFNRSKRETEITLKNLTKVMVEGLKLLDEAVLN